MRYLNICFSVVIFLLIPFLGFSKTNLLNSKSVIEPKNKFSINFQENLGQISDQNNNPRPDILFYGTDGQLAFHLKKNGISYQQSKVESWKEEINPVTKKKSLEPKQTKVYRVDVNWIDCNTDVFTEKLNALPGYNNYYLEDNSKKSKNN